MGMLVPPAIFMIVIAQVTNTSAVALFVAGFIPAVVIMLCLMAVVYIRARQNDWPVDSGRASSASATRRCTPRCRWWCRS